MQKWAARPASATGARRRLRGDLETHASGGGTRMDLLGSPGGRIMNPSPYHELTAFARTAHNPRMHRRTRLARCATFLLCGGCLAPRPATTGLRPAHLAQQSVLRMVTDVRATF